MKPEMPASRHRRRPPPLDLRCRPVTSSTGCFCVSIFVNFYEAFVGIKPHWILFQKFFWLKPQPSTICE
jgi:hypothetical protein